MPGLELHNVFIIMRHGQSEANVAKLITSRPENAIPAYGLTDTGKEQARISGLEIREWIKENRPQDDVEIHCSDFKRTRETAEVVRGVLGVDKINPNPALRERNFGDFELTSDDNYERVWAFDLENSHHTEFNSESPASVAARAMNLVNQLDIAAEKGGKIFILVAHGDVTQIVQTQFKGLEAGKLRTLPHVNTAGWVLLCSPK